MTESDDFLGELGVELGAAYNVPPETPREALWAALQTRRALRAAYHPPPETPREAIWRRLETHRGVGARIAAAEPDGIVATATGPAGTEGEAAPSAADAASRPWSARRWAGWALPIAATLLVGISIGRFVPFTPDAAPERLPGPAEAPTASTAVPAPAHRTPDGGGVETGRPATRESLAATTPAADTPGGDRPSGSVAASAAPTLREEAEGPERLASGGPAPARDAEKAIAVPARPRGQLYRVAALETLGGAEALLGSVGRRDGFAERDTDAIAEWGEDMLSQTRLLMDSPAADDPAMRVLLEDLELVLAQLVRLGEGTTPQEDLELIERAVLEQQLLHRIRAVLPAGRVPVTVGT
ncbi:MAG TPA: hypothetical protein VK837_06270 [Longimicrobiales bacterium]|nr:hypothetical protein [Longimicrobiales bacterium]